MGVDGKEFLLNLKSSRIKKLLTVKKIRYYNKECMKSLKKDIELRQTF